LEAKKWERVGSNQRLRPERHCIATAAGGILCHLPDRFRLTLQQWLLDCIVLDKGRAWSRLKETRGRQ
jgi:hypothetical protein